MWGGVNNLQTEHVLIFSQKFLKQDSIPLRFSNYTQPKEQSTSDKCQLTEIVNQNTDFWEFSRGSEG